MEMDQIGCIAHPGKRNPGTPGHNTVHRTSPTLQRENQLELRHNWWSSYISKHLTLTQARITQARAKAHANLWRPPYKALSVVEARRVESFW